MRKIFQYLIVLLVALNIIACTDDITNPPIGENEIQIYLVGSGASIHQLGWQGFDVEVGDSLTLDLQVSPKNDITCKWVDVHDELLTEGLSYTYIPTEEENIQIRFIATRTNEYADTVTFRLNAVDPSLITGNYGVWNNQPIEEGVLTGKFDAYFTVNTTGNALNSVVGLGSVNATAYTHLSCIVRFNNTGKIDVYRGTATEGGAYDADADFQYAANTDYSFKMSVDMANQTYSVVLLEKSGDVVLASDYYFRAKASVLNTWTAYSDGIVKGNGIIKLRNKRIEVVSQDFSPRFETINKLQVEEGKVLNQRVTVINPLGGMCAITLTDAPRFASIVDNGDNTATLKLAPYGDCGGCDMGTHTITLRASYADYVTNYTVHVEVIAGTN